MLALAGLTRRHVGAAAPAVDRIDLEVAQGEVLVLVGPSGCGKSTILRLIAGLDEPDAGSVVLDGRDLAPVAPQDRDVAMVFQGYALYPNLSARDNIAFPLKMRKVAADERNQRVDEAAALLAIGHLMERRPDELSGGERQRVAMGRAIVRRPKLFLFDEPLSNLDAARRAVLRVELAGLLRKLGATAIYVTHDQVEAMTIGHRIAVMKKGSILQAGAPKAVYADPSSLFVAEFLGSTRINAVTAAHDGPRAVIAGVPVEAPSHGGDLTMAVRPEDLRLGDVGDEGALGVGTTWNAKVVLVEPLGSETIVHCDVSGETFRARVPGFSAFEQGNEVRLFAPEDKVLWFDASSGDRVRSA